MLLLSKSDIRNQRLCAYNSTHTAMEITVDIVVVSMLEMGFAEGELATLDTIYDRVKQMGLETCPVETAAQIRLQFRDQPNYTTEARLGLFLLRVNPLFLRMISSRRFSVSVGMTTSRNLKRVLVYG